MIDEELRASSEKISEGRFSFVGLEAVLLLNSNPRQLPPRPHQLVATASKFLLGLEQLQPGRKPLLLRNDLTGFGSADGFDFQHNVLFCIGVFDSQLSALNHQLPCSRVPV